MIVELSLLFVAKVVRIYRWLNGGSWSWFDWTTFSCENQSPWANAPRFGLKLKEHRNIFVYPTTAFHSFATCLFLLCSLHSLLAARNEWANKANMCYVQLAIYIQFDGRNVITRDTKWICSSIDVNLSPSVTDSYWYIMSVSNSFFLLLHPVCRGAMGRHTFVVFIAFKSTQTSHSCHVTSFYTASICQPILIRWILCANGGWWLFINESKCYFRICFVFSSILSFIYCLYSDKLNVTRWCVNVNRTIFHSREWYIIHKSTMQIYDSNFMSDIQPLL